MLNGKNCARLGSLYFVPVLALFALATKLYYLQVIQRDHYAQKAERQHTGTTKLAPTRGKIFDAKGHELAGSALVTVAYMNPRIVASATSGSLAKKPRKPSDEEDEAAAEEKALKDAKLAASAETKNTTGPLTPADPKLFAAFTRDLAKALRWDAEALRRTLTETTRTIRLPLDLNETDRAKIEMVFATWRTSMPRKALWFEEANRRHYPHDDMAAHIVGYTIENETGDNKGMAGVEKSYDEELRGTSVTLRARTNAMQNLMEPADNELLNSTYGQSVVLTIDDAVQEATERALAKAVLEQAADSAVGVVLRVKTGEVLAMASVPTYRISNQKFSSDSEKRNRAVSNAIEPGSVMKIFTFSCLFDQGRAMPDEVIATGNGTLVIGTRTVRDVHSIGSASSMSRVKELSAEQEPKLPIWSNWCQAIANLLEFR